MVANGSLGNDFRQSRIYKNATLGDSCVGMQEAVQHLVSLCAMLHDVDDWKYCSMAAHVSQKRSIAFLESLGADQAVMDTVAFVLDRIGFKESLRSAQAPDGGPACGSDTAELVLHIVQDADRLDALGTCMPPIAQDVCLTQQ